jgi:hypothetical protein
MTETGLFLERSEFGYLNSPSRRDDYCEVIKNLSSQMGSSFTPPKIGQSYAASSKLLSGFTPKQLRARAHMISIRHTWPRASVLRPDCRHTTHFRR